MTNDYEIRPDFKEQCTRYLAGYYIFESRPAAIACLEIISACFDSLTTNQIYNEAVKRATNQKAENKNITR